MNIVISDPKTGKNASKKLEQTVFMNRKIGEEVDLGIIGLTGFKAKISGGSDKQGFPMKPSLQGNMRRKILMQKGTGFRGKRKGVFKRKSARGNTVSEETQQLNLVITKPGDMKDFESLIPKEKVEEKKVSVKEEMVKESLENVGNVELAGDPKKIKGKVRG
ncbi:MAG: 30S ribosomal protein S6e [Candidatus Diapherotrites archaeon]|nr:30S ribosomal protein S6e [Candidatus Diapherotrites archaeon]